MKATGLVKHCPRCKRVGVVFQDERDTFVIDWPARAATAVNRAEKACRDTSLHISDLLSPTLGCGYDDGTEP